VAQPAWPTRLVLVRHAESVGNLARDVAEANGEALIDIATRDMDVPLSPQGERQAAELGEWLAQATRPAVVYSSPYVRAATSNQWQTALSPESVRAIETAWGKMMREFGYLS